MFSTAQFAVAEEDALAAGGAGGAAGGDGAPKGERVTGWLVWLRLLVWTAALDCSCATCLSCLHYCCIDLFLPWPQCALGCMISTRKPHAHMPSLSEHGVKRALSFIEPVVAGVRACVGTRCHKLLAAMRKLSSQTCPQAAITGLS